MSNQKPIKILFLASSESIHSHKWITYFSKKNDYDVYWLSLTKARPPLQDNIQYWGFSRHFGIFGLVAILIRMLVLVRKLNPDLIHVHSAGLYGLIGSFLLVKPMILTVWGSDVVLNSKKFLYRYLLIGILQKADIITSDAKHIFTTIEKLGVKKKKTLHINFGIDVKKFRRIRKKRGNLSEASISKSKIRVISTRNLEPIYDIKTLIKAAYICKKRKANFVFSIFGFGSQENELQQMITKLELESTVQLCGRVENDRFPELLSNADIYVSTSKSDAGIAASTAEAMACECLPIISDVFDNHQWIMNGKTGFLFEVENPKSLADTLMEIESLSSKTFRKIAENARHIVVENNDYETEMDKMDAYIKANIKCWIKE